jgi:hypothetical protein
MEGARTEEDPMSDSPQIMIPALPPAPEPSAPAPSKRKALIAGAIVGTLILITGITVYAFVQGGSAEAQPLALSFTQGQSQTYEIHQTMDADIASDVLGSQPISMDITQVVGWEVVSVADDGTATIEVTVSEMSGTVNGTELPDTPVPPIEIVIAPDGRIVSAGGLALGGAGQTQGFGFPGMGQLTPLLPDEGETVAVGDSWDKSYSQEFPFGEGTIEFTATSTYERDETVNGREAAVIVTEMTVPMEFTLSFADLLEALGPEVTGATGADLSLFEDAQIAYAGEGIIAQTSFVDLEAKELLQTESSGTFEIVMSFTGIPGLEVAGPAEVAFDGTFTQEMALR